jgi:hypothetical protein
MEQDIQEKLLAKKLGRWLAKNPLLAVRMRIEDDGLLHGEGGEVVGMGMPTDHWRYAVASVGELIGMGGESVAAAMEADGELWRVPSKKLADVLGGCSRRKDQVGKVKWEGEYGAWVATVTVEGFFAGGPLSDALLDNVAQAGFVDGLEKRCGRSGLLCKGIATHLGEKPEARLARMIFDGGRGSDAVPLTEMILASGLAKSMAALCERQLLDDVAGPAKEGKSSGKSL